MAIASDLIHKDIISLIALIQKSSILPLCASNLSKRHDSDVGVNVVLKVEMKLYAVSLILSIISTPYWNFVDL